jgi:hypothetical protein
VSNISFEDISYHGKLPRKSLIDGADEIHNVRDIRFKNFEINNTVLSDTNKGNYIEFKGHYEKLQFE